MTTQQARELEAPVMLTTENRLVAVYGSEHISKQTLMILGHCINMAHKIGVHTSVNRLRTLIITDEYHILADSSPDHGTIMLNLKEHFDSSLRFIEKHNNEDQTFNLLNVFHHKLLTSMLHELHHLHNVAPGTKITPELRAELEEAAEDCANDSIILLARIIGTEPDHYSEEPFFCLMFHGMMEGEAKKIQQTMFDNSIFHSIHSDDANVKIRCFREFIQMTDSDRDSDEWKNNMPEKDIMTRIASLEQELPPPPPASATLHTPGPILAPHPTMKHDLSEFMPEAEAREYDDTDGLSAPIFDDQNEYGNHLSQHEEDTTVQNEISVPENGHLTAETITQVVNSMYGRIYNHIFTYCQPAANGSNGFNYADATYKIGMPLSPLEQKVIVGMDCLDINGFYHKNASTSGGALYGSVTKEINLPIYNITISFGGKLIKRTLIPQWAYKRDESGDFKKNAMAAQQGNHIMYIIDSESKKYLKQIYNGKMSDFK